MSLHIHSEPTLGASALRRLVIDSLGPVLGGGTVVVPELPIEGGPILALGTDGTPIVISFDAEDATRAVVGGLQALEEVTRQGDWLVKLCPDIPAGTSFAAPRLVALAPEVPSGATRMTEGSGVFLYTYRALRVNGEQGLLIEPWQPNAANKPFKPHEGRTNRFRTGEILLTPDEQTFFEHI